LQCVDPRRAEQSTGGEVDRHDAAADERANPARRAGQDADDRGTSNELGGQNPQATEADEARDDGAHHGAVTEFEEVASGVEAVFLRESPDSRTHPEGERERRDTG
jgi:hypothetical protein